MSRYLPALPSNCQICSVIYVNQLAGACGSEAMCCETTAGQVNITDSGLELHYQNLTTVRTAESIILCLTSQMRCIIHMYWNHNLYFVLQRNLCVTYVLCLYVYPILLHMRLHYMYL